jgi:hypothetical protein
MFMALAVGAVAVSLVACGSGAKHVPSVPFSSSTVPLHGYIQGDKDGDADKHVPDGDDASIRDYGHAANADDRRAAIALLRRYYAAAVAGDLATACSLTDRTLARSGKLIDTVAEDYAPPPGSPSLRGESCTRVMAAVTKERHEELAGDIETFVLTEMRVLGARALAIVGLRTTGERVVPLRREAGRWRVDGLFDSGVT